MIVTRFTSFTEKFVIRCYQVAKIFPSGHDWTSTSSARSHRSFRLQADITIWVLRKVRVDNMLTRTRFLFCSRLHWQFMRRTGSVSISKLRFPRSSDELRSSTKLSLNSCTQSGKSCNRSLCASSRPSFLFLFSVSVDSCSGFHRSSSLTLSFLSGTGFSLYLVTSKTESCHEDDEEVGVDVMEELVDKPGTTNGISFDILPSIKFSCHLW